ncbi:hypothetical protein ACQ4PT_023812 [Festuca glaucescens]
MAQLPSPRRSGRIAIKKKARLLCDGAEAIQELIARVGGILGPTASFDDASRAAYKQLFMSAPLAASAIHALEALVKQVNKLNKKAPTKLKEAHVTNSVDDYCPLFLHQRWACAPVCLYPCYVSLSAVACYL